MTHIGLLTSVGLGALLASAASVQAQSFDWNGFYAGASVGTGVIDNRRDWDVADLDRYHEGALTALATAGVNIQSGQVVYGLEGDIGLVAAGDAEFDGDDTNVVAVGMSPVATLRGRAGYAADNLLFYGTAGLAIAKIDIDDQYLEGFEADGVSVGAVLGAGIEVAVNDNMSIKAEGRLMHFAVDGDDGYTSNVNSAVGLVGVNFHF